MKYMSGKLFPITCRLFLDEVPLFKVKILLQRQYGQSREIRTSPRTSQHRQA